MKTFARLGLLFAVATLALPACGWGDDTGPCHGCLRPAFNEDFSVSGVDLGPFLEDLAPQRDLSQPAPPPPTDGGTGSLSACETCLAVGCATPLTACENDPSCATTLACTVSTSCFTSDPSSNAFGSCVDGCTAASGLTLAQSQTVVGELNAMSACYGYCTTECNGS
jgi:hypothetical protein